MSGTTENRSSVLPQVTLVLVCVTTFMLLLDTTVVNLALADLQNSLGVTLAQLQWVIDAYLLTLGTFLLLSGAAGDRFGQNRLFVIGLIIFTAGSLGCSISPNVALLVVARGVQGVGGRSTAWPRASNAAAYFQGSPAQQGSRTFWCVHRLGNGRWAACWWRPDEYFRVACNFCSQRTNRNRMPCLGGKMASRRAAE